MYKNIYEILDEFQATTDEQSKINVLKNNYSELLVNVLKLAFDPKFQFHIKQMPEGYKWPDTLPGVSYAKLNTELRRLYLFRVGDPTAEKLTQRRREELLINLCESLEPKEAAVVLKIMNKDLRVDGLNKKLIDKVFPGLL